jgi:hypothetical protein
MFGISIIQTKELARLRAVDEHHAFLLKEASDLRKQVEIWKSIANRAESSRNRRNAPSGPDQSLKSPKK